MKTLHLTLAMLVGCSSAAMAGEATPREQAMAATAAFGKALKTELVSAMQAGGPLAVVDCFGILDDDIAMSG